LNGGRELGDGSGATAAPSLVEHFFRHEYGRLVAMLTRRAGAAQIELVEDAVQADQALLQGNRALLPQLDKGVPGKTPGEILIGCNRELGRANAALEDKLKELEDVAGGGESPE